MRCEGGLLAEMIARREQRAPGNANGGRFEAREVPSSNASDARCDELPASSSNASDAAAEARAASSSKMRAARGFALQAARAARRRILVASDRGDGWVRVGAGSLPRARPSNSPSTSAAMWEPGPATLQARSCYSDVTAGRPIRDQAGIARRPGAKLRRGQTRSSGADGVRLRSRPPPNLCFAGGRIRIR